jgi:hypothetical protein
LFFKIQVSLERVKNCIQWEKMYTRSRNIERDQGVGSAGDDYAGNLLAARVANSTPKAAGRV